MLEGDTDSKRKNIHTITTTGDGWFAGKVSAGTIKRPAEPTEANDLITKKYFDENSGSGVGQSYPNEVDEVNNPIGAPGEIFNVYEDSEELPGMKKNIASGAYSHAEGAATTASGAYSHAEGAATTASGTYSHAEGAATTASGIDSHAEGFQTTASGIGSHAEGFQTTASGDNSHTEGSYTIASTLSQHVQGIYNVEDTEGKYAHIIGGGSSNSNRKNIHTVDWDGNAYFEGRVMVSENSAMPTLPNELVTMHYVNTLISGGESSGQNFLSDPVLFPLTIDQTIQNDFINITKLPDGYTAGNTLILSVIDIPNSVVYFGSSSYDFIIRITEDGYIQLRFINNAVDSGRQFYVLLCKFSLPTATSILELFNNNNIN